MKRLKALWEAVRIVSDESKALGWERHHSFRHVHSVALTMRKLEDELMCFADGTLSAKELRRKLVSSARRGKKKQ